MTTPGPLSGKTPETLRSELHGFPLAAISAVLAFRETPSPAALDQAMRAILEFYLPSRLRRPLDTVPAETRLREDLGVDSLTLAEATFKLDDLFGVAIETREAAGIETLGGLHAFLCGKMGLPLSPAPAQ